MPILGGNRSRENHLTSIDKKYLPDSDIAFQLKQEVSIQDADSHKLQPFNNNSFAERFKNFFSSKLK